MKDIIKNNFTEEQQNIINQYVQSESDRRVTQALKTKRRKQKKIMDNIITNRDIMNEIKLLQKEVNELKNMIFNMMSA